MSEPGRSSVREAQALVERHGHELVVAALAPLLSEERRARIEAVLDARLTGLTVVLENLYDPHNGAAAIRSTEAFGVQAVHAIEATTPFRFAHGITMGCDKWIDIHRHPDVPALLAALPGVTHVAAVPDAGATLEELPAGEPMALWFGNEHDGLTPAALAACTRRVEIPMFGFTRSFNLSVSVALLLSRAAERRRAALGRPGDMPAEERARRRARWYAQSIRGSAGVIERFVSEGTRPPWAGGRDDDGST